MSELIDGRVYVTTAEAAAMVGWKPDSFGAASRRGLAPKPARRIGITPLWLKSDVTRWKKSRPGRGARTDLKTKTGRK